MCNKQLGGPLKRKAVFATCNTQRKLLKPNKFVIERQSAFNRFCVDYEIPNHTSFIEIEPFLESQSNTISGLITERLHEDYTNKLNITLDCELIKMDGEVQKVNFKTSSRAIYGDTDISEYLATAYQRLLKEYEHCSTKGSGWTLSTIGSIHLQFNKFKPMKGKAWLRLPDHLARCNALINPINNDDFCFKWAFLAGDCNEHPENPKYSVHFERNYNFNNLSFPTPISDIKKFEKNNQGVSVNVFGLTEKYRIYPIKVVDEELAIHRDLLIVQFEEKTHYVLIKDFDRLVSPQISKHTNKKFVCKKCFTHHSSQFKLNSHKTDCVTFKTTRIKMPKLIGENKIKPTLSFKNVQNKNQVPFVIYADFEAELVNIAGCTPDPNKPSTTKYQEHKAISYGFIVKSTLPKNKIPIDIKTDVIETYHGRDAAQRFAMRMIELATQIGKVYDRNYKMIPLNSQQRAIHLSKTKCYLCGEVFNQLEKNYQKVADHCHLTGQYRGAAHSICNINYQDPTFINVILHGLSNYDSHFIVRELHVTPERVDVIPTTSEKYISFSKQVGNYQLRFLDSFRFLSSSLDSLAKTLPHDKFINISNHFPPHQRELLKRKGVFCYDFVSDITKLQIDHLPPKSDFHNKLNDSEISDEDYAHAQLVWDTFKCKNLKEYCDLYLKGDVLILADVFENFRNICREKYKLDPCWYYTLPGLAFDAALLMTGVKLELLTDYDMHMMVERGIRGGVAQCCKRKADANNTHVYPERTDIEDPTYIMYLDANNLYGWAMCRPLPTSGFEFVNDIKIGDILSLDPDGPKGYILEVDIDYPEDKHPEHNDLPYLPENSIPPNGTHTKLMTTLDNKQKYVLHYTNLQQAMNAGLILRKIHRVIKFNQSPWLKTYIMTNTQFRTDTLDEFEKDFFKLMNNAVFGKMMECVRDRLDLELVVDKNRMKKLIQSSCFKGRTIYHENLVSVLRIKEKVTLNKPVYVGMCILDISKTLMYDFHYKKMKDFYGDKLELLYMDTDSYIYLIHTSNVYTDIQNNFMVDFDTSDYPTTHACFSNVNKKVLGKVKDEAFSKIITKFRGLKAKVYCVEKEGKVIKRVKGVKKGTVAKDLSIEDFESVLSEHTVKYVKPRTIRSYNHILYSIEQVKLGLSAHDDKRYMLPDGIHTLAHGNVLIAAINAEL